MTLMLQLHMRCCGCPLLHWCRCLYLLLLLQLYCCTNVVAVIVHADGKKGVKIRTMGELIALCTYSYILKICTMGELIALWTYSYILRSITYDSVCESASYYITTAADNFYCKPMVGRERLSICCVSYDTYDTSCAVAVDLSVVELCVVLLLMPLHGRCGDVVPVCTAAAVLLHNSG